MASAAKKKNNNNNESVGSARATDKRPEDRGYAPKPRRTRALVADPPELAVERGGQAVVTIVNRSNRAVVIFPTITLGAPDLSVDPVPREIDAGGSVRLQVKRLAQFWATSAGVLKIRSSIGFFEIRVPPAGAQSGTSKKRGVRAQLLRVAVNQERGSEIWFDRGTDDGVAVGWHGELVRGGEPLVDGTFRIHTAEARQCIAKVAAAADQIDKRVTARLSPRPIAPKVIAGKLDPLGSRCEDGQTDAGCWLPQKKRDNLQGLTRARVAGALRNAKDALGDLRTDEKLRKASQEALKRAVLIDIIFALAPPIIGGALKGVVRYLATDSALRVLVEGTSKAAEPYWKAAVSGASAAAKRVARTVTAPQPNRALDFVDQLARWLDAVGDQLQLSIQHRADDELLALYELYEESHHATDIYRRQFRQKLESYRANVDVIGTQTMVGEGSVQRGQEMRVVRIRSNKGPTRVALCRYVTDDPARPVGLLRFESSPSGQYWFVRWVPEELEDSAVAEQTSRLGGIHTLPADHAHFDCAPENVREYLDWVTWSQNSEPNAP